MVGRRWQSARNTQSTAMFVPHTTMTKWVGLATVAIILPSIASSFHYTSSFILHSNRWVVVHQNKRKTTLAGQPPDKGDLYNDDELFELLNLHQALNPNEEKKGLFSNDGFDKDEEEEVVGEQSSLVDIHDWVLSALNDDDDDDVTSTTSEPPSTIGQQSTETVSAIPGLHEMVLETIEEINSDYNNEKEDDDKQSPTNQLAYNNLQTLLRDKKPFIRAIATDVDGTLLAGQYMHPTTEEALLKAFNMAYNETSNTDDDDDKTTNKIQHFFPATGKSRLGAVGSLGSIIGPLLYQCPGVYIQGLYCVDKEGNAIFEKKLTTSAIKAAEELVQEFGISIVGYDGDDLYTIEQTNVVVSLSEFYGEPTVQLIFDNESLVVKLAKHDGGMHKLLLMDEDLDKLALVRPKLEELAMEHDATVTQAIPTMLELLPKGCSKGDGVQRVCEALGIDAATELLALGDAENDVGMLQLASIGVAVANACPQARDAADIIMRERHDEGGAGLAINLFGF